MIKNDVEFILMQRKPHALSRLRRETGNLLTTADVHAGELDDGCEPPPTVNRSDG